MLRIHFPYIQTGRSHPADPTTGARRPRMMTAAHLALVGLVTLTATACQPGVSPSTAAQASGLPTGDPPLEIFEPSGYCFDPPSENVAVFQHCLFPDVIAAP